MVCFVLVTACTLLYLSSMLQVHGISDSTQNGFFSQPEDSVDILLLGNCHAYSAWIPSVIEKETNARAFMLGAGNMDAKVMYYYLKAALKHQSPECVVIEPFAFAVYDSYVSQDDLATSVRMNVLDLPFPDRMSYVFDSIRDGEENWLYTLLPIGFFHENWKQFEQFGMQTESADKGWLSFGENEIPYPEKLLSQDNQTEKLDISEYSRKYLDMILNLLEENNIKVLFAVSPYYVSNSEFSVYNYLKAMSEKNDYAFLNMADNAELIKMDFKRSFMNDFRHVNSEGAKVVSRFLGDFISTSMQAA